MPRFDTAAIPGLITSHDGTDVGAVVRRKARFGRNDWAVWKGRDGHWYGARLSALSIKAAMLARGTQGRWSIIGAGGVSYLQTWSMAVLMLRNWRFLAKAA